MEYTVRELEKWNKIIEQKATELGLDYYPQEFEIIGFNEMIGYEAYVGMPSRYPHWSYGKAYEKNKTLYSFNLTGLPYEMVINSDPWLMCMAIMTFLRIIDYLGKEPKHIIQLKCLSLMQI